VPFDELRREEAIVWIVFSSAAPARPALIARHAAGISLMRDLIRSVLVAARDHGALRGDLDLDTESVLLAATIDGLLMHALSAEPGS